jgi:hypothetical protein
MNKIKGLRIKEVYSQILIQEAKEFLKKCSKKSNNSQMLGLNRRNKGTWGQ